MSISQVIRTWFGNEAPGYAKGVSGKKSKVDTRGHPTSVRSWTPKAVCGVVHAAKVSEVQIGMSGGTEKILAHYRPALGEVYEALSPEEKENCKQLAKEWNTAALPEDVQRR